MTDADLTALRIWAEAHAPLGYVQARQVLALLDRDALRLAEVRDCDEYLAAMSKRLDELKRLSLALAERVAGQSELLSRRACVSEPVSHPCA